MGNAKPLHNKESFCQLKERFETDKEIADHLEVSAPTVAYWKKKHIGKEQRESNGVYFKEHKGDRHFQFEIRNETVIAEHALAALGNGADPYKLFSDDTHVHHKNNCSMDNRPKNLIVVDEELHQKIHQNEDWAKRNGYLEK